MKTDIEIAQECTMEPITEIAERAGIPEEYLEQYGKYKAKIDYNFLKKSDKKDGSKKKKKKKDKSKKADKDKLSKNIAKEEAFDE